MEMPVPPIRKRRSAPDLPDDPDGLSQQQFEGGMYAFSKHSKFAKRKCSFSVSDQCLILFRRVIVSSISGETGAFHFKLTRLV